MRRIVAVVGLIATVVVPAPGQADNTGGSGWTVNVYNVATATNSGFYDAFNPAGGEPGAWQANDAFTEWISAWSTFSTTPGAGDYDRATDANARYHYTYRYTFAQPLSSGTVVFFAGWDNIFKSISTGGSNPVSGVPSSFVWVPAPERSVDEYFGFCRDGDGMHNTGDGTCTAVFNIDIGGGTTWMDFAIWGDGQTDGLWLEWNQKSLPPQEVIPEPATMTLLATGLAGMAAASARRRRRRETGD